MKTKSFAVSAAIIIGMNIICIAICAWQTACLISLRDIFSAEHPSYVLHSLIMLVMLLVLAALSCGQVIMTRKRERPVLCGFMSAGMIMLEVQSLQASADQQYLMGILASDYGIRIPFHSGWLLIFLVLALIVATTAQLLIVLSSALIKRLKMQKNSGI